MRLYIRLGLAACFGLLFFTAQKPASDLATRVLAALEQYVTYFPPEKVYVMCDKPVYATGENMWFKAWLTNGINHVPNAISRIMYIELKSGGETVLKKTIRVDDGSANGDFFLPETLVPGTYELVAYTSWMRNNDPEFFFRRTIDIVSNAPTLDGSQGIVDKRISVQILPEGGELVAGIPNVLGIISSGSDGKPLAISGSIINNTGSLVTEFSTDDDGLGRILITPEPSQRYTARFDGLSDSEVMPIRIQDPLNEGFVMHVDALQKESLSIRILNNVSDPAIRNDEILIIGHVRGVAYYAAKGRVDREEFTAVIDRERFPAGIIHFTLFTADGTPVAERLIYNAPNTRPDVVINTGKPVYKVREKAEIAISIIGSDGSPLTGDVAISVTNDNEVYLESDDLNIENYLYLVSDLYATVHNAGRFNIADEASRLRVDNLMLTKGWRRFDWQKIMTDEFPEEIHQIEMGLTISGSVVQKQNRRVTKNQNVILALLGDVKEFYQIDTDDEGRFTFLDLLYPDSTEILIQTIDSRKRRFYDILLDSLDNYDPRVLDRNRNGTRDAELKDAYATYLRSARDRERFDRAFGLQNDIFQLGEITVTAQRNEPPPVRTTSLFTSPDRVIRAEDVKNAARNPIEMLAGRTAAFRVTGFGSSTEVSFNRSIALNGGPTTPLFILDGMEVDLQTMLTVPGSDVESIELLTDIANLAIYGTRGNNGVIAVNTKPGGPVYAAREGIINQPFPGYAIPREFYAPDYSEAKDIHRKPDSRATIWWEPKLIVDKTNGGKFSFWTSDDKATYTIRIEGLSGTGNPVVSSTSIRVE